MLYDILRADSDISTYITRADETLAALGYTEHSFAHVCRTAEMAATILSTLGYDEHTVDLARSAGYLHDIGNLVNRVGHSLHGAIMAFRILEHKEVPADDIAKIVSAIGNHDEGTGVPVNELAAALILADKSDVRRSRVRNRDFATFDIHDRVNYSVRNALVRINEEKTAINLFLTIDTKRFSALEYFEIFMERMLLCRRAAEKLGLEFHTYINDMLLA